MERHIVSSYSDGSGLFSSGYETVYKDRSSYVSKNSPLFNILFWCLVFLVVLMLYHTASHSGKTLTFSDLLGYLQNMPLLSLDLNFANVLITDSWGLFDFLRVTINLFIVIANVIAFLFKGIMNVLSTVIYLLVSFLNV